MVFAMPYKSTDFLSESLDQDSPSSYYKQPVQTGTTIVAIEFDKGVVIAADSRTSTGQYVADRTSTKMVHLHDRIYTLKSGSAADTQALAGFVKRFLSSNALEIGDLPRVNTAASLMQLLCHENKEHLTAALVVAGWDKRYGAQVYQIGLTGSKIRCKYAIGGSGSAYISALCETQFKESMSKAECVAFAKKAISNAINFDGSSGGIIRIVVITEDEVEEEVVLNEDLPNVM